MAGGENKVSELLPNEGIPAVESNRTKLGPLGTSANKPAERTLRVITQVVENQQNQLKPLAGGNQTVMPTGAAAVETHRTSLNPAAKETQAFAYQNAVTIEDGKNG